MCTNLNKNSINQKGIPRVQLGPVNKTLGRINSSNDYLKL